MCLPRVRFTLAMMMVAVAVLGAGMGLVALFARFEGMTPARLSVLVIGLALWGAALNIVAFSILWLFKRVVRAIAHRTCRKA